MRRNGLRVAAIGAVSLGLAGCFWPAPGAGPGRTAYNSFETEITPATVADLALEWTATGDGAAMGPPITSLRGVHASDPVGVYAFSFDTGARLWTQPVPPTAPFVVGPVVADGDRVVLGYGFGNLGGNWITSVRDAATGTDLGSAGVRNGLVDGLEGGILLTHAFHFGSGTPVVTSMAVSNLASPGTGWSSNIDFGNGGVSRALTLGHTRIYGAGGGPISPTSSGNAVRAYLVATPPAQCPAPAPAGFGCPVWVTPISGTTATPPVIDGSNESVVYTGTNVGDVYALDTATGSILWTSAAAAPGQVTDTPALAGGYLYVPTTTGLLVLDAATGATEWTAPAGSLGVQPAVAGGLVFTGAQDGTVMAFDATGCGAPSCGALWNVDSGDVAITGAPAVNQGRLYVGTSDSRLLAYGLPGGPPS
jgi:outer membrane protein assembly factor BamB